MHQDEEQEKSGSYRKFTEGISEWVKETGRKWGWRYLARVNLNGLSVTRKAPGFILKVPKSMTVLRRRAHNPSTWEGSWMEVSQPAALKLFWM